MATKAQNKKGFTLIELLIVIGILAVLLAITIIAINPARQFAKANNSARLASLNAILNAATQCFAENKGAFSGVGCDAINQINTASTYTIQGVSGMTTTGAGAITTASPFQVNLCGLVAGGYVASLPKDPSVATPGTGGDATGCAAAIAAGTVYNTGFTISKNASNKVTIAAPLTDTTNDTSITAALSVTR